ncbi:MAG: Uma2 family endonuclease [Myxococcales bacterium]|nr:Uma2 family endonuclease [Myxococcales bacterium]
MAEAALPVHMTFAEYLAFELASAQKHEWLGGQISAMAGGTIEHGALALAAGSEIRNALRDKPCRVLSSDVRVRVLATGLATYPDVTVVRGRLETDPEDANTVTNPVLVVEVLSDSTEAYDRGQKFAHYRRIPSLREYVLVAQRERRVEVHRRNEQGRFELFEFVRGEVAEFATIGCRLSVDELYRNPLAAEG